jgi:hypothetical protein
MYENAAYILQAQPEIILKIGALPWGDKNGKKALAPNKGKESRRENHKITKPPHSSLRHDPR